MQIAINLGYEIPLQPCVDLTTVRGRPGFTTDRDVKSHGKSWGVFGWGGEAPSVLNRSTPHWHTEVSSQARVPAYSECQDESLVVWLVGLHLINILR
jgi:hypothetical protein